MATKTKTETDLNNIYTATAEGIEQLHNLSEQGDGGRARILFYALAGFLQERGIIDYLNAAANYMNVKQAERR